MGDMAGKPDGRREAKKIDRFGLNGALRASGVNES
jgi:hypothetical protein